MSTYVVKTERSHYNNRTTVTTIRRQTHKVIGDGLKVAQGVVAICRDRKVVAIWPQDNVVSVQALP
ncbi:hypothetical protein phiGM223_27 [Pseudomonas phage phiGM22-3]|uniref:Uncharacterized protein n=1 Tax=Pseudomonas phage phiGM22-3 TaxID=2816462 RepID=A0A8T8IVJ7_9CAUD|nr:hypothetical protein phiGM223_27 [Pseudomonas phage phiGM22-3]